MLNILFVDAEPTFLGQLQEMVLSMKNGWKSSTAANGVEALAKLEKYKFDVVISDMQMSEMDGTELLRKTQDLYPDMVRIILAGYEQTSMVMKSLRYAHQYLAKPSDTETLKQTIRRTCSLRDLLTRDSLRSKMSQLSTIPSLPGLYSELMDEINSEEPSIKRIGQIVEKDVGMTVKILQIVNSAFFGLQRHISNATEAAMFLGVDTISSLTLSLGIFAQFEKERSNREMLGEFRRHSEAVGALAKFISSKEKPETANDAFTAGLVHDIGELILAFNLPKEFALSRELAKAENISTLEAEKEIFDATHAEIGAYLLGLWGIPWTVVEAVAYHHNPSEYKMFSFAPLTSVHVADVFDNSKGSDSETLQLQNCDIQYLAKLDLLEKIPIWHQKFTEIDAENQSDT